MMISKAIILQILSLVLSTTTVTGKAVPAPTKGCDKACQKECINVLNEYRANHDAPKLEFSQVLADKAQKWADGGKFGYDMDARGKYGQLIEWDVKDEFHSFTSAIKHWHDKEKDFDFTAGKSKNGNTLHDFTQVVWKKAHKAGCGRGKLYGSRYYVVWMDADGVISPNGAEGSDNVGPPKRTDIHWFEITKIKAVGEPLYWNSTNSTKPSTGNPPNVRVKTSLLPTGEEGLNSVESEANVLNDANNIKQYVRESLSSVLAEENKEVSLLRDEFEGLDDVPNVRLGGPSQEPYQGIADGNIYDDREIGMKQVKPVAKPLKWNKGIKQPTFNKGRKFQKEALNVHKPEMQKIVFQQQQQQQAPVGKLPATVDAGHTKLSESSPTTVIHEELNISDKNTAAKPVSSKPKQVKNNLSAGKRHGSEETSQYGGKEMAGVIMGKMPDNETGNEGSQENSNGKILKIANDENLSPEMENELSKVSKFINTRLKALNKDKELHGTPERELKNGYKEQGKSEDPLNGMMDDEPGARPARITMVGAPLSFPEKKHKDIVKDIHEKVTALWNEHLKNKKGKEKKVRAQSNGEDDLSSQPFQDGFNDSLHGEGSFSSTDEFHDGSELHGYQYTAGGHHQETYPDNYDQNPLNVNKVPSSNGNSFNGFSPPIHQHAGGDWFGGPALPPVSPTLDDPITHAMNTGPGGLYEYRKKYTSEEPEKDSEPFLQRKKNSLQSVVDVFEDKDGSVESAYSEKEKEPVLQPVKMPKETSEDPARFSSKNKPQDHKDLLALPKELTEHPDSEMTLASQLPDLLSDTPSTSMTNSEESDHPEYFNDEPGLNRPTFVEQSSQKYHKSPTSNGSPGLPYFQTRPSYGYTQPLNSPVMQPQAVYAGYPYVYRQSYQYNPMQGVAQPQGMNQGYGYNQQQEPIQSVQEQTYNPGYGYPQQVQVQGSMPSMPQVPGISSVKPERPFGNAPKPLQPQKILKGVSLPSSMGVITDNEAQQSGLTLSDKSDKSPAKKPEIDNAPLTPSLPEEPTDEIKGKESKSDSKGPTNNAGGVTNLPQNSLPQQGQGEVSGPQGGSFNMPSNQPQNGMPQDGSTNGATITVDGKPVKGPYNSSGVYTVKGPFVYQTDTTIIMGGPQNSGNSKPMNGGGSPSQVPNSTPQNVPPSSDNNKEQTRKPGNENSGNEENKSDPELPKRPSLITLLKEAEMNKQKESESKENKEQPDENKEGEKEGSSSSGERPEGSGENEKLPNEAENGKPPDGSTQSGKETAEGSSENEKPSRPAEGQKEPQGPSQEAKPEETSENEEQPAESSQEGSSGSSEEKQQQQQSKAKGEDNNQLKIETEPNGPEENKNTQGSEENEKQPNGPKSNGNEGGGSTGNAKPQGGSIDQNGATGTGNLPNGLGNGKLPGGSSENEQQPSGSSENEKQPSGSSENEKQPSGPSENEKQPGGSSENEKHQSGSSENEEPPSGSSDNQKAPSGSTENENQPSGSIDPSVSSGNEKQPGDGSPSASSENEKQSSGSSENEVPQSGSIDPSGSSVNQKGSSGSSENEKVPTGPGLPGNGKPQSGSIDPSTSPANEKKPSSSENKESPNASSENGKQSSSSSENEEPQTGSIDPSGSSDNQKQPSGPSEKEESSTSSIDPNGSSDNQKPSSESENENQPSGSIDPTDVKETRPKEPFQTQHLGKIFLTQPEAFKDAAQTNKEGKEGVSIYDKPPSDLPKGAHYEPAIEPQNPLNSHGGAAAEEKPIQDHYSMHNESQTDHSKQMKAKLLLPFTRLISNINHALGLDAPNSTLKINHISLSSKHPNGKTSQAAEPNEGKIVESSQETSPQEGTGRTAGHQPLAMDVPEDNSVTGVGEALNHDLENQQNQIHDVKVNKPEHPSAHHGQIGSLLSVQEHRPFREQDGHTLTQAALTPQGPQGSNLLNVSPDHSIKAPQVVQHNVGDHLTSDQQGHLHATPALQKHLKDQHVTDAVDESHSTGTPHVQEINESPIVEVTHPGSSCKDDGERCSLWQKRGHCRSVLYAGFMKRHCKATCGYCALPSIVIQSERAGIKFAYEEHACQDSTNYEFSCPAWKAQGYCQKKEKEMRRFCRSTCNFCKRKKISKKKKKANDETQHDQSGKATSAPSGNSSGQQPQSYANAQTGQGNGAANAQAGNSPGQQQGQQPPNYAHAQVGKPSDPQSTAYASGGSTYVQTQSSGGQQTGYAVASAAASPQQQTYAQAQSNSQSGQPSKAYAQNSPSTDNRPQSTAHAQTGSDNKPQNVAHAQTSPINDDPKQSSKPKNRDEEKVSGTKSSRLHEMSLEEKVMSESPEYNQPSNNEYYIKAGNMDETAASEANLYDEAPLIRFPNKKPEQPTNSYAETEGKLKAGMDEHNPEPESSAMGKFLDDAETKAGYLKDDLKDMEVKDNEDQKVQMLMSRFDPVMPDEEDDDLTNDKSMISTRIPDKKGTLDFVSTEGCDQICQRECLDAINSYRRNHNARPLILDQDLATHAQQWADSKTYGHSPWAQRDMGGELIAVGSFYKTFTAAVKAWHDEEKDFDWEKGELKKGKVIKHFKQLISKDAHVLGCGKSMVNGEPYYIAQMDAAEKMDNEKRETMERPEKPDLGWYMESSPYWKDLQTRAKIPNKVRRRLL